MICARECGEDLELRARSQVTRSREHLLEAPLAQLPGAPSGMALLEASDAESAHKRSGRLDFSSAQALALGTAHTQRGAMPYEESF